MIKKIIFLWASLFYLEIPVVVSAQQNLLSLSVNADTTVSEVNEKDQKGSAEKISQTFFSTVSGQKKENAVKIMWAIESAKSNQYFIIERSGDGENFEAIGSLKVKKGSSSTKMRFIDTDPLKGDSFYRIKQINFKKGHRYSEVINFNF